MTAGTMPVTGLGVAAAPGQAQPCPRDMEKEIPKEIFA